MSNHKVGDVCYLRMSGGWGDPQYMKAEVVAVTKTQISVKANGTVRRHRLSDGYEVGSTPYYGWKVCFDLEKCERVLAEQNAKARAEASYRPVRAFVENGRYSLNEQQKAELLLLVQAIVPREQ